MVGGAKGQSLCSRRAVARAGLVVALAEEDVLVEPVYEEGVEAEGADDPREIVLLGEDARWGEVEVVDAPEH